MVGIYKITNKINGKCYIGQSIHIEKRWWAHKHDAFLKGGSTYDYPLYQSMRKYGLNNFAFEVIEECSVEELNEKEIHYIKYFNSFGNGYNQGPGGTLGHYNKLNDAAVRKIIERLKTSKDNSDIIGDEFGITGRTVREINLGQACRFDDVSYPVRPSIAPKRIPVFCIDCGKEIDTNATRCVLCDHKRQRRATRPSKLDLAKMIVESSFVETAKRFGVSDNSIKKWCKQYGLPHRVNELRAWYYDQIGEVDPKTIVEEKPKQEKRFIQQIDIYTEQVVNTFESTRVAAKAMGVATNSHIIEACNGKLEMAYGYKWRYISESEYNK